MLIQIALLYGASWLAAAAVAGVLEWAQLTRSKPLPTLPDLLKAAAIAWIALPLAIPTLVMLPAVRRRRSAAARAGA